MSASQQFALDFNRKLPPAVQEKIADGMKRCDDNADERWRHVFDGCVLAAARRKPEITVDDVLDEIEKLPNPPNTHNLAAMGPAMKRAARLGVIKATDKVKRSTREIKHGNRHTVWESKFYGGQQ